eukprot:GFKZ01008033.1.p1 GENE.GFKZ01008033.1~~GFKZ01008033.1.p1  ORF type:complete len:353 (-),score=20.81 GFKZ01008033.1:21-1079(-)
MDGWMDYGSDVTDLRHGPCRVQKTGDGGNGGSWSDCGSPFFDTPIHCITLLYCTVHCNVRRYSSTVLYMKAQVYCKSRPPTLAQSTLKKLNPCRPCKPFLLSHGSSLISLLPPARVAPRPPPPPRSPAATLRIHHTQHSRNHTTYIPAPQRPPQPTAMNGTTPPPRANCLPTPTTAPPRTSLHSFDTTCTQPLDSFLSFLQANNLPDNLSSANLYQVHEDLRLVRKWTHLRVLHAASRPYLIGQAAPEFDSVYPPGSNVEDGQRIQAVVAIGVAESVTLVELSRVCDECVGEQGQKLRCVTVGFVDEESSTAYYRITNEWKELVHPQWEEKRTKREDGEVGGESGSSDSEDD